MELYIIIGVIAVLLVCYILCFNKVRKLRVKVEEGSSGIDVALEKRFDLLSEEIEAVKKYLNHERELYKDITALRQGTALEERKLDRQEHLSEDALNTINAEIDGHTNRMMQLRKDMKQQNLLNEKIGLMSGIHRDLSGIGSSVNALAEQYPVLYSSISMEHFQKSIFDAEEHLQAARRLYNANASLYNQALSVIPTLWVGKIHGMKPAPFYEVEESKKQFTVNFD